LSSIGFSPERNTGALTLVVLTAAVLTDKLMFAALMVAEVG
jgi:hypothetical protein